jgi:hypothetical protein
MSRIVPGCIVVSCAALVFTGCGKPEEDGLPSRIQVSALVTYLGQPVSGAHVTFVPENDTGKPAFGSTNARGVVELSTFEFKDGAIAGEYTVTVSKMQIEDDGPAAANPGMPSGVGRQTSAMITDLLPRKYKSRKTSGLAAKVVSGEKNDFTFDLK